MGNRTECALLQLVDSLGVSYAEVTQSSQLVYIVDTRWKFRDMIFYCFIQ